MSFRTPILFLIFNRPAVTQRVFEEIKNQKPKYLYVAADGARPHIVEDLEKCKATRELVIEGIDWDCEVKTLFRDENLGCGRAVSEAITWFFENVEQGIILEDDCLPHFSFFGYCEIVLEQYKEDERVYAIGGTNLQKGKERGCSSYFFSKYPYIWGWASWRRAWAYYDYDLKQLDRFIKDGAINKIDNRVVFRNYWIPILQNVSQKNIDTWDYQWMFTIWNNDGVVAVPNTNLISNIGFGEDATHTGGSSPYANMPTSQIKVIKHPKNIKVNKRADRYVSDVGFHIKNRKKLKNYMFFLRLLKKQILLLINNLKND